MKLAIRADGGSDIGYGHIIRTGALAHESLRHGDDVLYFTQTPDAVDEVLSAEVASVSLDSQKEVDETVRYVDEYDIDVIFTDSFAINTEYQKRLSDTDAEVAVRHNYRQHTVCCDFLVYGDLHAPNLEYDWVGLEPQFCLGPDYILLREQFQRAAESSGRWRDTPTRALVVMGGSDVNNTTPSVMRTLDTYGLEVDVVIGPGFSNAREIEQTSDTLDSLVNLLYSPENMATLMQSVDLAVTATGGTVFELLATHTPFIGIPQAENQSQRAAALRRRDLSLIAEDLDQLDDKLTELLSQNRRRELFEHMADVVDGRGAKRIHNVIS